MTVPFIGTNDLSDALGEDVTTDDNAVIALDAACQQVRDELGNVVNLTVDEVITLDGTGHYRLILPQPPVREVSEVVIDAGLASETTLEVTDYALESRGYLRGVYLRRTGPMTGFFAWPFGFGNITVTYTHGWDVTEPLSDPPDGFERVPSSIRQVALQLASRVYRGMGAGGGATGATTSLKVGTATETYDVASAVVASVPILSEAERDTLAAYKVPGFK